MTISSAGKLNYFTVPSTRRLGPDKPLDEVSLLQSELGAPQLLAVTEYACDRTIIRFVMLTAAGVPIFYQQAIKLLSALIQKLGLGDGAVGSYKVRSQQAGRWLCSNLSGYQRFVYLSCTV